METDDNAAMVLIEAGFSCSARSVCAEGRGCAAGGIWLIEELPGCCGADSSQRARIRCNDPCTKLWRCRLLSHEVRRFAYTSSLGRLHDQMVVCCCQALGRSSSTAQLVPSGREKMYPPWFSVQSTVGSVTVLRTTVCPFILRCTHPD